MIVVDASVAFKWLKSRDEPYHKQALSILEEHLLDKNKILVPNLLFIEIANSLVTKTKTIETTIKTDLESLYSFKIQVYIPDSNDIFQTAMLAKKYKTTVYDMLYTVVAKKHKTILVTSDEKFIKKTGFSFVKNLTDVV